MSHQWQYAKRGMKAAKISEGYWGSTKINGSKNYGEYCFSLVFECGLIV